MPLLLLRHTRVACSEGLCYGNSEVPLATSFASEAEAILEGLPRPDGILSSPLRRCLELARAIEARYPNAPLRVDNDLREMDLGNWQGRLWSEIPRSEVELWAEDFYHARPHRGENVAMLQERVWRWLDRLCPCLQGSTVIGVTHKGVIRAALSWAGVADAWSADIDFGQVVRVQGP